MCPEKLAVSLADAVDKIADGGIIEPFVRVIKLGIVDVFDGISRKVNCYAMDKLEGGQCSLGFFVVRAESFALCS